MATAKTSAIAAQHASRKTISQMASPVPVSQEGPKGRRLTGNVGPGTLRPGAGKQVQRTGQPLHCGVMWGLAFDFEEHPNSKDKTRTSVKFVGQVQAVTHAGEIISGMEWYLPPTVTRALKAAMKIATNDHGGRKPVPFSIEVWCEPDEDGRPASPLGYSYVSYDRSPTHENDPLLLMAYEAGILERPAVEQPAQLGHDGGDDIEGEAEEIDPETGEVIR